MDITNLLIKKYNGRAQEIGKFNVSSIWGILNGYTGVEEYLNGKENDFNSCKMMWSGTMKHTAIQELFEDTDYEIEKRVEYRPDYEWYIVGKADLINKDHIIEIKTSDKLLEKAKSWHELQVKFYCTMFERPEALIVQPVVSDKLVLKEIGRVKRNDKWVLNQLEKLNNFYEQLKQSQEKQNS